MTSKDLEKAFAEANKRIEEKYPQPPIVKGKTIKHSWIERKLAERKLRKWAKGTISHLQDMNYE